MHNLVGVSRVDIVIANNVWWTDAFQFGDPNDQLTWSLSGKHLLLDVKEKATDMVPLLALSDAAGTIVVDDDTGRVLHIQVDDHVIRSALPAFDANGEQVEYHYDLVMVDSVTGQRDALQWGALYVTQGVTVED